MYTKIITITLSQRPSNETTQQNQAASAHDIKTNYLTVRFGQTAMSTQYQLMEVAHLRNNFTLPDSMTTTTTKTIYKSAIGRIKTRIRALRCH